MTFFAAETATFNQDPGQCGDKKKSEWHYSPKQFQMKEDIGIRQTGNHAFQINKMLPEYRNSTAHLEDCSEDGWPGNRKRDE